MELTSETQFLNDLLYDEKTPKARDSGDTERKTPKARDSGDTERSRSCGSTTSTGTLPVCGLRQLAAQYLLRFEILPEFQPKFSTVRLSHFSGSRCKMKSSKLYRSGLRHKFCTVKTLTILELVRGAAGAETVGCPAT